MNPVTIDDRLDMIARELIAAGITREQAMESFERKYLVTALQMTKGNVTLAAQKLGVHRNTLINRRRTLIGEVPMAARLRMLRERRNR